MSTVAVVILNWNGSELLPQYLPSILAHSSLPNVRLVVADNGSSDNSLEILARDFPTVEVLALDQNYGFAAGYNRALSTIEADYYVLLNSDVALSADWLPPMVAFLDAHPEFGACQPKIRAALAPEKFEYAGAAGGQLDLLGYPYCRGRLLDHTEDDRGQYDQLPQEIFWASGACLMIRAALYHRLGGLDTRFWAHMEEIDLCWRAQNAGYRIGVVPQSVVYHLGGGSLNYGSPRKLLLNYRNNLYLLYKNLPGTALFPTLLLRMLLDGLSAFVLVAKGQRGGLWIVLQAHLQFYAALPWLHAARKSGGKQRRTAYRRLSPHLVLWSYYALGKRRYSEL